MSLEQNGEMIKQKRLVKKTPNICFTACISSAFKRVKTSLKFFFGQRWTGVPKNL